MCNINGNQMIILRSCLRTELGRFILNTQHEISQIVNLEYADPVTGIIKFGSNHIPWLYKATKKCLMIWMKKRKKVKPQQKQVIQANRHLYQS